MGNLTVFMVVLFWMFWKKAKLSLARASAYSIAVLVFNLAVNIVMTYKMR